MNMSWLTQYAMTQAGRPYRWGGDDPLGGYDCSGFVQELLMAAAVIPRGTEKMSAQMLYDRLVVAGSRGVWKAGSIAFFGKASNQISHIGFCLDDRTMIHAGSGGSTTTSIDAAERANAFVRLDSISYRRDLVEVIRPVYPGNY